MLLAIETSCDDTAVCLYDGQRIISHVLYRQTIHASYGGVIPEWASREHEVRLPQAVLQALQEAQVSWDDLQVIAAAQGPGLLGSLMVGHTFARAIAAARQLPFIGVHHLEAHVASLELSGEPLYYPFVALVATGGHTHLFRVIDPLRMELIGKTQDDAVGEALDKVAAWIGLPYPGGPAIEALAQQGNPQAFAFPQPRTDKPYDFSFSGLKTAFLYTYQRNPSVSLPDLCASWQEAVFTYLVEKLLQAARAYHMARIALVGGVAANKLLRQKLTKQAEEEGLQVYLAPLAYCMDNAAMIAVAAWHKYLSGQYTSLHTAPFARG
ncbi:MAG: tRNA (adenosine(37)-N6)-threonylcarbamoyltransferase complex transferase subunit TsaD [Bacteroidia bacterium]|nr:tRNA (adenosine(37)-N6)-threonylcarbamoyltransferase complex transferase subunit TsaD [Bacteroidia bacterium]MDW8235484.1 tRNA (adenosine(37)-N6)-threonylcarbamoyltransferase complex transferase subunit TsaD [Bacteroidia bacterium]